jgi:hypothetical protein
MAEPTFPLKRAIFETSGYFNDVLSNIMDLCRQFFTQNETLKRFSPRFYSVSPPKTCFYREAPVLHIYICDVKYINNSAGVNTGKNLSTHIEYHVKIDYVYTASASEETQIDIYDVACHLVDQIRQHHNINGVVNGPSRINEVTFGEQMFSYEGNKTPMKTFSIQASFGRSVKGPLATR